MAHPFLTIRTSPDLKAALEARAAKEGRSTSAVAVRALEAAVKRWAKANGPAGAQADEAKPARRNHADANHSTAEVNRG
jgi:predicted transcriptional regulator